MSSRLLTKTEERRQFERIMRGLVASAAKRHPCEVTADRLIADAISKVRHWLLDRAEELEKGGAG